MKKTQDDKLQLIILVLEARKKTLTFKVRASFDVSCPKLHKLSKLQNLHKLYKHPNSTSSPLAPQPPQPLQARQTLQAPQ
jgi:hypothetical protein